MPQAPKGALTSENVVCQPVRQSGTLCSKMPIRELKREFFGIVRGVY